MTAVPEIISEIDNFRNQAEMIDEILQLNVAGLTHEETLILPRPGGNCLNWVVGHLLWAYNYNLPVLGRQPVIEEEVLSRYARGVSPLENPTEALHFQELLAGWEEAAERFDSGLANLDTDAIDQPATRGPDDETDETIRERVNGVLFHQSYHVGQTGLLRRLVGKKGAVG